jgi:hypothetical protein
VGKTSTSKPNSHRPPAASLHARPARTARLRQDITRPPKPGHAVATGAKGSKAKSRPTRVMDMFSPQQIKHHQPQGAKTLMRSVVSRPKPGLKRSLGVQAPIGKLTPQPNHSILPKWPVTAVDPVKARHSLKIHKSKMITRFAPEPNTWYNTPAHAAAAVKTFPPEHLETAAPKPHKSMDIFEKAIQGATSHQQPKFNPRKAARAARHASKHSKKPVHHRLSSIVGASLAFLLLFGFITYQDRANITMRFANAKAGFHATLPAYKPSGYAVGTFHYGTGKVAVNYANDSTHRNYTFSQATSNLNSQTMLSSLIAPHSSSYQTLQYGGRTIFIYGDNNAAWVDEGVLYQITSNGSLSTGDILDIAKSI